MKRAALALLALALSACSEAPPVFPKMSVDLPMDDGSFPAGPGVEAVTNNCAACHSADMILNQPKQTREQWAKNIDKMRKVFKASIAAEDEAAILDYLEAVSAGVK